MPGSFYGGWIPSYLRRSLILWEFLRIPFTITFFIVACLGLFFRVKFNASFFLSSPLELIALFGAYCVYSFIITLFFNGLPILDCLLHAFCGLSLNHIRYLICFSLAVLLGWMWSAIIPIGWFFFVGSVYRG